LPEDSAPGDSLAGWVTQYSQWGSPLDTVRVRYRRGKVDKSWFVQPSAHERGGWERALDVLLPLLADKASREALAATIGRAARPIIQEALAPVIKEQVVDTLTEIMQGDGDEPEHKRDLPGRGADMAS